VKEDKINGSLINFSRKIFGNLIIGLKARKGLGYNPNPFAFFN
jgi:hypothetical protein